MKKATALFLVLIMLMIPCLSSCGDGSTVSHPSVVLSKANVTLTVGDEYTLGATLIGASEDAVIEWSSSEETIVSCDDGRLRALREGIAVITATVNGGNAFTSTVTVGTSIRNHANLFVGDTRTIKDREYTNLFDGDDVVWTSTNPAAATCENGVITALASGDTVIKATCGEDTVSIYSVSVFNGIEDMVEFTAPDMPVTLEYAGGKTTVQITDFSYVVTTDDSLDETELWVTFMITYKKVGDIGGADSQNTTGFYIDLFSDEVGHCTQYRARTSAIVIGESAEFKETFVADMSLGMRHFYIVFSPIE